MTEAEMQALAAIVIAEAVALRVEAAHVNIDTAESDALKTLRAEMVERGWLKGEVCTDEG